MSNYKTRHPYTRIGFLINGDGRFWEGHESLYTKSTLEYYAKLVEQDRLDWEKREKFSLKKMTNER